MAEETIKSEVKNEETARLTIKDVNQKVEKVVESVDKIVEVVSKMNSKIEGMTKQEVKPLMETFQAPNAIASSYQPKGYVPQKYRQIVDEILSSEFGLDCIESKDNMDFEIQIIVPMRFSSLTTQEKQAGVNDIRSKVISRALGENGIRDWCIKVRQNLNKFYVSSGVTSPFSNQAVI